MFRLPFPIWFAGCFVLGTALAVECVNPATVIGAAYVGCFTDSSARVLTGAPSPNIGYTATTCLQLANSLGAYFFGLEDGGQCFYGSTLASFHISTSCTTPCSSDNIQRCGGYLAIDVWEQSGPSALLPTVVTNSQYLGCGSDQYAGRVLPLSPTPNTGYTPVTCQQLAASYGAIYFGVEAGGQCFYGNSINSFSGASCPFPCSADSTQRCGGNYAIDVYESTLMPALLPGAQYLGCFVDEVDRALQNDPHVINPNDPNTAYFAQICQTLAKSNNATYFGLEDGGQCFYGSTFKNYGPSGQCSDPCANDPTQRCGGVYAIDVWQNE